MRSHNLKNILFALLLITIVSSNNMIMASERDTTMAQTSLEYFVQLLGTRENWPENMTTNEEHTMQEHFEYIKNLVKEGKVIIAGPVFEKVFGMIILRVNSESEALTIMNNEPSVVSGVHTFKMYPMRVSLMAEYISSERYVQQYSERILSKEVLVQAGLEEVWETWTTTAGVKTFFSNDARIELKLSGPYEIYFITSAPHGLRGSEGCRILSYLPMEMLSFEWNAPPSFGELRNIHTQVILRFEKVSEHETRIKLAQLGWGDGENWNKLYDYFDNAWSNVLNNLKKRFTDGPFDWK